MKRSGFLGRRASPRQLALYNAWVGDFSMDLFRMAYRLCGSADTAEDLTQETFYHAWKNMSQLRDPGKAKPWLFQILRRRYARWVRYRSRRIRPATTVEDLENQIPAKGNSPVARVMDRDTLQTALNELEEPIKVTLLMVFLGGLTCREAAEALDLPLGTVLSRIHRARQHLRSAMPTEIHDAKPRLADDADADQPRRLRFGGGA